MSQKSDITYLEAGKHFLDVKNPEMALSSLERYFFENPTVLCESYYYYARALDLTNDYLKAKEFYERCLRCDKNNRFPMTYFYLGLTLKKIGLYSDASQAFTKFKEGYTSKDDIFYKKAQSEENLCLNMQTIRNDSLNMRIELLPSPINTEYSEYNAILCGDDSLFFCSYRLTDNENISDILDETWERNIFYSELTAGGAQQPVKIDAVINDPQHSPLNFCFSPDKQRIYFTKKIKGYCEIWYSQKNNKNKWSKAVKLNHKINTSKSNNTQPCIGVDKEEKEILYFVSDRENGYGGYDIWYAELKDNNNFEDVYNAGSSINSYGNEITPFYHSQSQTLYFSSDWHEGFGGYDIFSAYGSHSGFEKPVNMGFPLNSSCHDLSFSINEVDNDGYFTSNRAHSYSQENLTCCNDIYSYEWNQEEPIAIQEISDTIFISNKDSIDIVKILPITLYFHNDEPDPKSTATTTQTDYLNCLHSFVQKKDLYLKEYAKGLSGEAAKNAQLEIELFFQNYLYKGYDELDRLTNYLIGDLQQGKNVEITVAGYASPLNTNIYNEKLSQRRIQSLINYLMQYQQGILQPYYYQDTINQFIIKSLPKGDSESKNYVSDNPNDIKNSIYSIAACLARRISILEYHTFQDTISVKRHPVLTLAIQNIDIQTSPNQNLIIKNIEIQNTGNEDLKINNIQTLNPFIQINCPKKELKPLEKTIIALKISMKYMKGKIRIPVKIMSNDIEKEKFIFLNMDIK